MDTSEALIRQHLELRDFSEIVFEPDGNIPPDFVIGGDIAVEVRRLNQSIASGGRMAGLEESAYPLSGKIESLLKSFGPPNGEFSWFVIHHFSRPLPPWPDLKAWIKKYCTEISGITDLPAGAQLEAKFDERFDLVFLRASEKHENLFLMGGFSDYDSGGFVLAEIEKNIRHCIEEKSSKVRAHRGRYREWWLALVDYVGYGLSKDDQDQFRQFVKIEHDWDKIIVVSPLDPMKYFEL